MQSLQSQQAALSQTERIKSTVEESFSDTKENQENNRPQTILQDKLPGPFQLHEDARDKALAALLLRAREERENKGEELEPKNADEGDEEEEEDQESKDESMETSDIPQMTIKPVEVLPAVSKPLELNMPSAGSQISAQ